MPLATYNDLLTFVSNTPDVSDWGQLLIDNQDTCLDTVGVNDGDEEFAGMVLMPNNDELAAWSAEVRYLKKRPRALCQTIAAHTTFHVNLWTETNPNPDPNQVSPDLEVKNGKQIATNFVVPNSNPFQIFSVGAEPEGPGNLKNQQPEGKKRRAVASNGWSWDFQGQKLQVYYTAGLTAGTNIEVDPIVGVYDNQQEFLLPRASKDTLPELLGNAPLTVETVLDNEVSNWDLGIMKDVITIHGQDIYKPAETYDDILTLLLPSDAGLANLFEDDLIDFTTFLLWNADVSSTILQNHAVDGTIGYWLEDFTNSGGSAETVLTTLNGKQLKFPVDNSDVLVNLDDGPDSPVPTPQIDKSNDNHFTENAVVHVLSDGLIISAAEYDVISNALAFGAQVTETLDDINHQTFLQLFGLASDEVQQLFNADNGVNAKTLLAPTEAAFDELELYEIVYFLQPENQADLDTLMRAHLLNEAYFIDYSGPVVLQNALGHEVPCSGQYCGYNNYATLSDVQYANFAASYSIDKVIMPRDIRIPKPEESDDGEVSNDTGVGSG